MIAVGSVVGGRYRIVRLLGSGGMGAVYEGVLEPLSRRVAIKTLLPDLSGDPALLGRFRREAEASAALGHPNIVQVTDFVSLPGEPPLIVMELLEGATLKDHIVKEGRLDPARAVFIGRQILSGLASAHRAGIIHRDIKPGNVFLQSTIAMRDLVKIVDFGLAKLVFDASHTMPGVTKDGQILGTLAYMAPEQASGRVVDARADIWAVGATLFHALSGFRPTEVIELGKGRRSLASVAPWLDPRLAAVVDRALEKRPEDRFADAEQMAEALAPFAAPAATSGGNRPHVVTNPMTADPRDVTVGSTAAADATRAASHVQHPSFRPPGTVPLPPAAASHSSHVMPLSAVRTAVPRIIVICAAVALALMLLVPTVWYALARFQMIAASGVDQTAMSTKAVLANARLLPCPTPERCTERRVEGGITYPLCTNKMPKQNPFRSGDYAILSTEDGTRLAAVTREIGGGRYSITFVGGMSLSTVVDEGQLLGRVCRPGPGPQLN